MSAKADASENNKLDTMKWLSVWLLLAAGVLGFYYFSESMLLLRVLGLLVVGAAAVFVVASTEKGRFAKEFLRGAHIEVRKVVWPSRQETLQVTGVVVFVVILMSLMIWMVDSILFWIVQKLTT